MIRMKRLIILLFAALPPLCICACSAEDGEAARAVQPAQQQESTQGQDILCAGDKVASVVQQPLPEQTFRYTLTQADTPSPISFTYSVEAGITLLDANEQELQQIELVSHPDDPTAPIAFLDFNQDGYADIMVTLGGTLNSEKAVYLWDQDAGRFVEVSYDGVLSYFEVCKDHIQNWVKDSARYTVVQTLVWSGPHTLALESETVLDTETGETVS